MQTPFSHDDYAYCFYYDVDSYTIRPTNIRVTNVFQMFESMWHHYLCVNGRFVSHTILQCFSAFWGKGLFNICNTLVFMLFLHIIVMLSDKYSVVLLLVTFIISMCLLPFPGQTMLWMTGSINYLWTATFTLVYLYWMKHYKLKEASFFSHIITFILCFLIGWTNESITVPVAFGLFLYFYFNRNHFRGLIISSYIGYSLGAAMIVFGPGTFVRLSSSGEVSTQMNLVQFVFLHAYNLFWGFLHAILPLLVLVLYMALFLRQFRKAFNNIIHSRYAFLFIAFTLFLYALGMNEDRMFFGFSVICLLIIYKYISPLLKLLGKKYYITFLLLLISIIPIRAAFLATHFYYEYNDVVYNEIIESPSKCVVKERNYNNQSRYTYVTELNSDIHSFHNRVKAFYYGKDFIQALPVDLYDAIIDGSLEEKLKIIEMIIDGENVYEFNNYWLLPVLAIPNHRVFAEYTFDVNLSSLSPKQKFVRYLLNTLDSRTKSIPCFSIEIDNNCYLVFPKDDCMMIRIID